MIPTANLLMSQYLRPGNTKETAKGSFDMPNSQLPRLWYSFLLISILLTPLIGCGGGGSSPDPLPTLAEVRALEPGTVVTTAGYVSVEAGVMESTTGEIGFALQDSFSGIYITVDPGASIDLSGLKLGRSVQVTGVVGSLDEFITLSLGSEEDFVISSSGGFLFFPQTPSTNAIATGTASESESQIVSVEGQIVVDPEGSGLSVVPVEDSSTNLLGWNIHIDDNSGAADTFWNVSAGLSANTLSFLTEGANVQMTGILFRQLDTYEVLPRGNFDVSISIEDCRLIPDGETVLTTGVIGLVPSALSAELDYGFSLHSANGSGIYVNIADPVGSYVDYDGDGTLEFGNGATLPFDLPTFRDLVDPWPFFANNNVPVVVHVEGTLSTTAAGDRVLVSNPGKVRRVAVSPSYPVVASLSTGGIQSADLGRWVTTTGTLVTPPVVGSPYPGGANAWRVDTAGYRARINDGSGAVEVLIPYGIITDGGGVNNPPDGFLNLPDLPSYPFGVNIGETLTVYGFVRNVNGQEEILIGGEGVLQIGNSNFHFID